MQCDSNTGKLWAGIAASQTVKKRQLRLGSSAQMTDKWWRQHSHYSFHWRTLRRDSCPTALKKIPCIVFHSWVFLPARTYSTRDGTHEFEDSLPLKGDSIKKCLCRTWLNVQSAFGKTSNTPHNKGNRKHIHLFSLFCIYVAHPDLHSICHTRFRHTCHMRRIVLERRS